MPVPFPVSKVGSDKQKVEFLTISGRPKTRFFDKISGVPGPFPQFPLATNHAVLRVPFGPGVGGRLSEAFNERLSPVAVFP